MKNFHSFSVSFYIRRNRNSSKNYGIYACIKVQASAPKEICLKNSFRKEDWDSGKGRPKCISEELVRLSIHLDSVKLKLFSICNSLELTSGLLTAENVKNIYLGKRSNVLTVLQLVNNALKR